MGIVRKDIRIYDVNKNMVEDSIEDIIYGDIIQVANPTCVE